MFSKYPATAGAPLSPLSVATTVVPSASPVVSSAEAGGALSSPHATRRRSGAKRRSARGWGMDGRLCTGRTADDVTPSGMVTPHVKDMDHGRLSRATLAMLSATMPRGLTLALVLAACDADTLDIDLEITANDCEASDFAEIAVIEIAVYGEHAGTFCALARRCVYARDLHG